MKSYSLRQYCWLFFISFFSLCLFYFDTGAFFLLILSYFTFTRVSTLNENLALKKVLLIALLFRTVLSVLYLDFIIHTENFRQIYCYGLPSYFFSGDSTFYLARPLLITKIVQDKIINAHYLQKAFATYGQSVYHYVIYIWNMLMGFSPLSISILNSVLSIISLYLIHEGCKRVYGIKVAYFSLLIIGFLPSFIYLSIIPGKDMLTCLGFIISLLCLLKVCIDRKPLYFIGHIIGLYLFLWDRVPPHLFGIITLLGITILWAFSPIRFFTKLLLGLSAFCLLITVEPSCIIKIQKSLFSGLSYLNSHHLGFYSTKAQSTYLLLDKIVYELVDEKTKNLSSIIYNLYYVKFDIVQQTKILFGAVFHFILEPFIWNSPPTTNLWLVYPEQVLLTFLFPFAIIGFVSSLFLRASRVYVLYSVMWMLPIAYASGNIGSTIRHRLFFITIYCTIAIAGLQKFILLCKYIKNKCARI